jgi:signal transduction histidine kinase
VAALGVVTAAIGLGIAAEWAAYDGSAVRSWGPDLAVGWGLVLAGFVARWRVSRSRCGFLLCAAGLAWFAGNFAGVDIPAVAWIGSHGAYVHRALLAHAIVAFPRGHLVSLPRRGVAAFAYVAALWPGLATSDTASIALCAAVLATTIVGKRAAVPAAASFAVAVGGVALGRSLVAPDHAATLLLVYQAGLLVSAWALVVALLRWASAQSVADRVVELGERASVRDALRRVLDDPSLEVGFARDEGFIDERGELLPTPPAFERRVTALPPSGEAILVHDPSVSLDGRLGVAVSRALRLTTDHARLQAEALEQLAELRASRTRLVLARGRQRVILARRLRDMVERRLASLDALLAGIDPSDGTIGQAVGRARGHVEEMRESVAALARGLQPPALAADGLAGGLRSLAANSPVSTSLIVDERRFDAAVEHAVYLVCSEALSNVAKHAGASQARLRVEAVGGRLQVEVSDTGRGGANIDGNGLHGIAERIDELGGRLRVDSPPGGGTRLYAELPLRADRRARDDGEPEPASGTLATVGRGGPS